jgi:hypothetical protein
VRYVAVVTGALVGRRFDPDGRRDALALMGQAAYIRSVFVLEDDIV